MKINEYFDTDEFRCKCSRCSHTSPTMDPTLISMLTDLRRMYRNPIYIESGYRCPEHNRDCGGVEDSAHVKCKAVDIKVATGTQRIKLMRYALMVGFKRVGIGKNFIHLDVDTSKPQDTCWTYYK